MARDFLHPQQVKSVINVLGFVPIDMSHNLNSLKGVISGTI